LFCKHWLNSYNYKSLFIVDLGLPAFSEGVPASLPAGWLAGGLAGWRAGPGRAGPGFSLQSFLKLKELQKSIFTVNMVH